ncbi:histidine kinase [Streptomyces chumphonensis]|uniref:histidine kinase n=1 Tax=Streptomyces chumphonensis TaxID=1214925 RepID=A0A927F4K7_9ACTN|nr:histidine kinase [Streptomyces chumphonensis]MBD3934191.1 two-component sensor histidine kinase [Streptomyces chumphonensis]
MPFVLSPRPHRSDVLIAVAGLLAGLLLWRLEVFTTHQGFGRKYGGWAVLPLLLMCVAVLRRRDPRPWVVAVAYLALVGDQLTGGLLATLLLFTDVMYAAVMYGSARRARLLPLWTLVVGVAFTLGMLALLREPEGLVLGMLFALVTAAPAYTGLLVRNHRDAAAAERLRAEQTALLAEMDRTQAVASERARMARELHDLVANHLSAIALHATAAQSVDDAAATSRALGVIRESSVQGLAEMRRLIGILREESDDGEELATRPTLDGLPALVAHARSGGAADGLRFALHDGPAEAGGVPAPVELAAYRVVQEALTNALKHAAPGEVSVRLERAGDLTVTVCSPLGRAGPRVPGSGAGLVGMRERVELLGGTFAAGPDGDVWRVRARLPLSEGAERT